MHKLDFLLNMLSNYRITHIPSIKLKDYGNAQFSDKKMMAMLRLQIKSVWQSSDCRLKDDGNAQIANLRVF